jgi:hypothetical protein
LRFDEGDDAVGAMIGSRCPDQEWSVSQHVIIDRKTVLDHGKNR